MLRSINEIDISFDPSIMDNYQILVTNKKKNNVIVTNIDEDIRNDPNNKIISIIVTNLIKIKKFIESKNINNDLKEINEKKEDISTILSETTKSYLSNLMQLNFNSKKDDGLNYLKKYKFKFVDI